MNYIMPVDINPNKDKSHFLILHSLDSRRSLAILLVGLQHFTSFPPISLLLQLKAPTDANLAELRGQLCRDCYETDTVVHLLLKVHSATELFQPLLLYYKCFCSSSIWKNDGVVFIFTRSLRLTLIRLPP